MKVDQEALAVSSIGDMQGKHTNYNTIQLQVHTVKALVSDHLLPYTMVSR